MQSPIALSCLLALCSSLHLASANAKVQDLGAISFLPANPQNVKMFVDFTVSQTAFQNNLLAGDFSLRFRTWQSDAILFYCHDERRNFVQLEIRGGRFLFKHNYGDYIFDFISKHYVNDGKWHALNVGNPWVNLDGKKFLNANERGTLPRSNLITKNTLRPKENIRLLRAPRRFHNSQGSPLNIVTIFVGAVAPGMGNVLPFEGCLSDLNLGGFRPNLTALLASEPKRLAPGCSAGCERSSCRNGGRCLERWSGQHRCNCWGTSFVGATCETTVPRSLPGSGGVVLEFPLAGSVAIIGGKFGLMALPPAGQLILHIDGLQNDVAVISGASNNILLTARSRKKPAEEYQVSGSLADLRPPFFVRFWLWTSIDRLQIQVNDQPPVLGAWRVAGLLKAQKVSIGDPTAINQRVLIPTRSPTYSHFKGCLYNFQLFVKETDFPLELSSASDKNSQKCPPFVRKVPVEKDMANRTIVGGVKTAQLGNWAWYKVVIGVSAAMLFCLLIVLLIYTYHVCVKRSQRKSRQKGAYSQISYANASSVDGTNGIHHVNHSATTSPQHSMASTQVTGTPYKVPYRPPYVATSLVIRDGKHMAHIDSDVELADSENELP